MGITSDLGRRALVKRAAALGLVSVPAMGALSACASSGDSNDKEVEQGPTSDENPLGADEKKGLEVVIFDGGFGEKYAKDAEAEYLKAHPKSKVKHSSTQKIQSKLQPRFNGGTPPDLIDNSGAEQMDFGTLVGKEQLHDLTKLLDAPSIDDPDKKVRDTLRPGIVEMGQYDGAAVYALNYAYTIYGVWYSQSMLDKHDWEYPKTWDDMIKLCADAKKKGIAGWVYPGKYPYYTGFSLYPFIAKIGGVEVMNAIDNLEPNAWKHPAVKAAFEAYYELYKKGYILKGSPGLSHTDAQTAWNQGKALFVPDGSWVENEASSTTPKDFQMSVGAPSSLDSGDKMPYGTIWASGGEPFIVPRYAGNPYGGMELLRVMLGKKSSQNFMRQVSSLTALDGGTEGVSLPPGLKSANELATKAGKNIINPRLPDWYVSLEKEKIGVGAIGEMMAGRMDPAECVKKCQKFADEAANDDAIKKYKHQ